MAAYLIKSILCLLVLWGFYKVALEQTAAHHFKRFYLLGSLAISVALPLVTFSYTVEVAPQPVGAETHFEPAAFTEAPITTRTAQSTNWLLLSLALVYGAGVLLLGFRFLCNLLRLREKVRRNEHIKATSHINVLLLEQVVPHSFLKYIFLPKTDFKNNTLPAEVLHHEQAHVIQKHSWDILLIEFLQVVFWFNPVLMLLKKSVALNHEFLADQAALDQNNNLTNYTNLLFNYSGGAHHTALSSPINYSLTKKRILMLSKTRSVKKLTARIALFVPVLALCVYFFNQEIVAKPVVLKESSSMLGKWIDRKNEFTQFTIYNQNEQLWMKFHKDTFELSPEGKNLYNLVWKNKPSSASKKQLFLSFKPENNELLLNDNSFIRPENTYGKIFTGDWEGIDIDQKFYVRSENGSTIWTIEDQFGTNRYYPILTSTGFYFTYGNKDVYFTVDGNRMTSSEGFTYKKVKEAPKLITVYVINNRVSLISQSSSKDKLVEHLNAITADWSPESYKNYILDVKAQDGMNRFLKELNKEFLKTNLYKINSSQDLLSETSTIQTEKVLNITVTGSDVYLNGKETTVETFANDIDALSKNWTLSEKKNYSVHVRTSNPAANLWQKLQEAFETTALYKANPKGLVPPPPPPAPAPPKAGSIPPPPPPPSTNSIFEEVTVQGLPAPPPPPPAPKEMVRLAKDNIYYNDKKISAEKAQELIENSDAYNLMFNSNKGSHVLIIKDKN
ncbi:M56 family metallopeptidase [Leeuwenhoekiella palythoae]|uniref:Beta-lactamase regulating signal transducer with metallopeptidase domain n=1 Tax=Leeuwenhoekiella palythoae TaxID=573501 RepID=A0A1M5WZE3_9FLAO|nr:M56 family metallopeptidase [Leeuwenhoekiella palythoae]RXG31594.1 beta-lactamase regulating signal transducer with metallopeptidase domain [Leeuwenhoekiella palythoae]SHH92668.1 Signal transducer regulating beta-lactamase production, contains metallopeptidase domain [Leeuwenhoekiella palythoae]